MADGRSSRRLSLRRGETFCFASSSRRIAALSRWHVGCDGGRKMLVVLTRNMLVLHVCHRKAACSSSSTVLVQHVLPTPGSGAAPPVLLRIVQHELLLRLLRLLQPRRLLPRHPRPKRTWRWRMASDLRRPRVQRARSTRCWKTRASSLRRAARACSAARTRTPPRRRGMPRPAARSEWLMMCFTRSLRAGRPQAVFWAAGASRFYTCCRSFFWPVCARGTCARSRWG